jgi:NAD(P)-dependent dehydrogenase (short-subunit alcohol dehydrogenase family)
MGLLDGKVALVTGAGGGLGRAHAHLLAREGARVVINDLGGLRDGAGSGHGMADTVVSEIQAAGGEAVADYGSVSDPEQARAMVQTAVDHFGGIDILINNAGILRDKTFKKMDDDLWDSVIEVHLRGTYLVTQAAFHRMIEQGRGGRIIMTSSTSGLLGNFGQTNYGAAKAGIAGFARCLYPEAQKYGITVNLLAPGAWSRMTEDLYPEDAREAAKEASAPEKVSPAVVWLCSDEAAAITGRTFLVAGNRVTLLSWQRTEVAARDNREAAWDVREIGRQILAGESAWPPIKPERPQG